MTLLNEPALLQEPLYSIAVCLLDPIRPDVGGWPAVVPADAGQQEVQGTGSNSPEMHLMSQLWTSCLYKAAIWLVGLQTSKYTKNDIHIQASWLIREKKKPLDG